MILAGIDIGTNTLRLLVADTGADSFHELRSDRRITRLGESLDGTHALSAAARERTLAALVDFQKTIEASSVTAVSAVGTSALRNAANRAEFLDEVKRRAGITITVIDGKEEARLTLLGVSRAVGGAGGLAGSVVIDVGGGSSEIMTGEADFEVSLSLGAVYLTERFIRHDPPLPEEIAAVREHVRDTLSASLPGTLAPRSIVGTAGTVTTLSAVDQALSVYDPRRINGAVLSKESVDSMVRSFASLSHEERRNLSGLEHGREDIILAGAIIVQELMDRWQMRRMLVSDWGLREGIVLDLYARMSNRVQQEMRGQG